MDSPLLVKSKQFALDIIKVCNKVKSEKRESVLTNQLIRSGTSIGNTRGRFSCVVLQYLPLCQQIQDFLCLCRLLCRSFHLRLQPVQQYRVLYSQAVLCMSRNY